MADRHMMVKADGSEPHMAAHTTGTAHPAKSIEMHMCVDKDGGRRQRTKPESDMHAMVLDAAQPMYQHKRRAKRCSKQLLSQQGNNRRGILAEAKSSFIQKGNFCDFGIEKKRERDPG
jgi:hypothetical protein